MRAAFQHHLDVRHSSFEKRCAVNAVAEALVEGRGAYLGMQLEARHGAQRGLIQNGAQERLADAATARVRKYGDATDAGNMAIPQKHARGANRFAGAVCQEMPGLRIAAVLLQCRRDALLDDEHGMTDGQTDCQRRGVCQHDDGFISAALVVSAQGSIVLQWCDHAPRPRVSRLSSGRRIRRKPV
jgi:hypothetical protein